MYPLAIRPAALCLALLLPFGAQAHSPEEHAAHGQPEQRQEAVQVRFADVQLVDQENRPVHLERDLVAGHIAVVGFIYTSCSTVCPVISSIMGRLQHQLGERAGRDVQLISISVDPLRDTPSVLHAYAQRFQHGPGWSWLTGTPQAVDATLKGLGSAPTGLSEHPPLIMIGDARSGEWTRFYGFTDPALLLAKINALDSGERVSLDEHAGHSSMTAEVAP
ncbi:SCO family protein [Pseudomonas sp. UL073]|uniref:SCO family protein n=1 Tax=Zestomonas insulae TaxID=2809017 RepID=A0ABS2I988_9GAMM|nr:SCO family protein [Pseudomonas insulae]MBM7059203.1 SCO family protein [Pseudomonas insulae]